MSDTKSVPLLARDIPRRGDGPIPQPYRALGTHESRSLGDLFRLRQYGVNLETLHPGSASALRHSHSSSDEFAYVISGELVLFDDTGETLMTAGMCVGFPAGDGNAHGLVNQSSADAQFLVVGTRMRGDVVDYPDDDFQWLEDDGKWYAATSDGSPRPVVRRGDES